MTRTRPLFCTPLVSRNCRRVYYRLAAPADAESAMVSDVGHIALEVSLSATMKKSMSALPRTPFAPGIPRSPFGAIEAIVFLGHLVEIDLETVRDLSDGHRDASGSEVVADLDAPRKFGVTKQTLDLTFGGGIALLDLGAVFEGAIGMFLGGACRSPTPSRPVPPIRRIASPVAGSPRKTFSRGAADAAPTSMRLAT